MFSDEWCNRTCQENVFSREYRTEFNITVYAASLWFPLNYSLFKQIGFISQFVKYHFLFIDEDVKRNEKVHVKFIS